MSISSAQWLCYMKDSTNIYCKAVHLVILKSKLEIVFAYLYQKVNARFIDLFPSWQHIIGRASHHLRAQTSFACNDRALHDASDHSPNILSKYSGLETIAAASAPVFTVRFLLHLPPVVPNLLPVRAVTGDAQHS